jgi:hypothetical protein
VKKLATTAAAAAAIVEYQAKVRGKSIFMP